jgi:hypothetical protein
MQNRKISAVALAYEVFILKILHTLVSSVVFFGISRLFENYNVTPEPDRVLPL